MADKKSFILYIDNKEVFDILTDQQLGRLTRLLIKFAETKTLENNIEDAAVNVAYLFMTNQMKRDIEKYESVCKRRSDAGKMGGAPKGNKNASKQAKQANAFSNKQKQAKQADNDNVNDNDNDVLSLSKDNDNTKQASTAPVGAAQPAGFDEELYREIPLEEIDPNPDNWA